MHRTQPSGTQIPQKKTCYDWTYSYAANQPHAPSLIGDRAYSYDANANQTGWDHVQNGTRNIKIGRSGHGTPGLMLFIRTWLQQPSRSAALAHCSDPSGMQPGIAMSSTRLINCCMMSEAWRYRVLRCNTPELW
jgi:hypothetical protein